MLASLFDCWQVFLFIFLFTLVHIIDLELMCNRALHSDVVDGQFELYTCKWLLAYGTWSTYLEFEVYLHEPSQKKNQNT